MKLAIIVFLSTILLMSLISWIIEWASYHAFDPFIYFTMIKSFIMTMINTHDRAEMLLNGTIVILQIFLPIAMGWAVYKK